MCVADMNRVVHGRLLPRPVLFMATIGTITTGGFVLWWFGDRECELSVLISLLGWSVICCDAASTAGVKCFTNGLLCDGLGGF